MPGIRPRLYDHGRLSTAGVVVPIGVTIRWRSGCSPPPCAGSSYPAGSNVAEFWSHLTGWRLNIQAEGAIHSAYCDVQWLLRNWRRSLE